jgi:hypothetical protein
MRSYSIYAIVGGTIAVCLLTATPAFSALVPLDQVPDVNHNNQIDLQDVIASGGFSIGDKDFSGFAYVQGGSASPASADIAILDASTPGGDEAIRFVFGWFTQDGLDMESNISYAVTVTDPDPATMIDAVDLQFNGVSKNFALADVSEVVDDSHGNFLANLEVDAAGNAPANDFDSTSILPNQREILVDKDIQLSSAPTSFNNFATVSFVDNSYHQTPEPIGLTAIGIGAISMMRRRRPQC